MISYLSSLTSHLTNMSEPMLYQAQHRRRKHTSYSLGIHGPGKQQGLGAGVVKDVQGQVERVPGTEVSFPYT